MDVGKFLRVNSLIIMMVSCPVAAFSLSWEGLESKKKAPLIHALLYGNYHKVRKLVHEDSYLEYRHARVFTAALKGLWKNSEKCKEMIWLLLFKKFNPDVVDDWGQTPLMHAAFSDNCVGACLLAEVTQNLDRRSEKGWSAIHYAAYAGNPDVVQKLYEKGASITLRSKNKKTALHYVIQGWVRSQNIRGGFSGYSDSRYRKVYKFLLNKGLSPSEDMYGDLPLDYLSVDHEAKGKSLFSFKGNGFLK